MKGVLSFQLPEEREEFELAQKSGALAAALFEIRNEVFRPARKHGYSGKLGEFLNSLNEKDQDLVREAIGMLEVEFSRVCEDNGVLDFT